MPEMILAEQVLRPLGGPPFKTQLWPHPEAVWAEAFRASMGLAGRCPGNVGACVPPAAIAAALELQEEERNKGEGCCAC